jgi:hypothetical protein
VKRVIYAGSEFVTGDDIAAALLGCSQALAEAGEAETVSVPVMEHDGAVGVVIVLVGPASQIIAHDIEIDGDELVDESAVDRLTAIGRRFRPVATVDTTAPVEIDWDSEV